MIPDIYEAMTLNSPFGFNIIPANDLKRLSELKKYEIVNTSSEIAFDSVAEIAAKVCSAPVGLISFVDLNEVFFKSAFGSKGYKGKSTPRGNTLCSLVVNNSAPTIFLDTLEDPCLLANPEVNRENGVRFYAGVPVRNQEGFDLGVIAIADIKPRTTFSPAEVDILQKLANVVVDELELRLQMRKAEDSMDNNLILTTHDLKSPITSIEELINFLEAETKDGSADLYLSMIRKSLGAVNSLIEKILTTDKKELKLDVQALNISPLVHASISELEILAKKKKQQIHCEIEENLPGYGDPIRLKEVFDNLIGNAIKYSPQHTGEIYIRAFLEDELVHVSISDNGQGFSQEDLQYAFGKQVKLSSIPTGNERSDGLGLYLTKSILNQHKGDIEILSPGKDKGSQISITLPVNTDYNPSSLLASTHTKSK